jgi:hypothetical protein
VDARTSASEDPRYFAAYFGLQLHLHASWPPAATLSVASQVTSGALHFLELVASTFASTESPFEFALSKIPLHCEVPGQLPVQLSVL